MQHGNGDVEEDRPIFAHTKTEPSPLSAAIRPYNRYGLRI